MDEIRMLHKLSAELYPECRATPGIWFGKPSLEIGNKVFAALWEADMALKLHGQPHAEALLVPGAHLFDPRGKGHPLKEWVQIPAAQSAVWARFARLACQFVAGAAQALKDELVDGLVQARRTVLDAACSLTAQQQDAIFLGVWSARDLLAHLAGWDDTNRLAVQEILDGKKPSFWQHHDRDWKSYNAILVAEYRRESWAEMVAIVEESHRRLIEFLHTVPADDYVRHGPIRSLLRAEAKDEEQHVTQVMEHQNQAVE